MKTQENKPITAAQIEKINALIRGLKDVGFNGAKIMFHIAEYNGKKDVYRGLKTFTGMAYNRRNLLERIVEIQEIVLREKKENYLTQQQIFETIIKPQYRICLGTFNNYLGTNAKKELKQLQDNEKRFERLKDKAYKLYVVERYSLQDTARKLGITNYQMSEIAVQYNLKVIRRENRQKDNKQLMLNKEQKTCDKLRRIIEIQDIANQYPDKSLNWIWLEVIRDKYNISGDTFNSYMKRPAKEELKEVLERQRCREIAAKARRIK